jgi:cation diffusion facilitator CzcD-associated flavoprotein CzcO
MESTTFTVSSEFVVLAGGALHFPKIPQLPGWDDLSKNKHVFHSARWDYEYTGGSQEKPDLVKLRGKRVAIIGTGATAIQIVPELAKWAEHVYVVQRTPSYVGPRNQTETDPELWAKITSEKGWQEKRRLLYDSYVSNSKNIGPDVIDDGWTHTPAGSGFLGSNTKIVTPGKVQEHIQELRELDVPRTELLRRRVDEIVQDKSTAEKLKPWYSSWCKRPSFHDEYIQSFNKPNVTLIDTDGKGLDAYTKNGILFEGTEYEIDALVLATGFTFAMLTDPSERIGAVVQGRNGIPMKDYWSAPDSGTLFGVAMPGFPNLFGYFGRGAGASWNYTGTLDIQAIFVAGIIKEAQDRAGQGQRVIIEPSKEAEDRYGREVAKRALWYTAMSTCTPSYFNAEGADAFQKQETKTEEQLVNEGKKVAWGSGPVDYKEMTKSYIANRGLKGFMVEVAA